MERPTRVTSTPTRVERVLSHLLTVAALALSALAAARLAFTPPADSATSLAPEPAWSRIEAVTSPYVGAGPPFDVIVAVDFECAACGSFLRDVIPHLERSSRAPLSIGILHFPLPSHPSAVRAAEGFECARMQGAARTYAEVLGLNLGAAEVDSLVAVAAVSGVTDTLRFVRCLQSPEVRLRVAEASRLSDSLQLRFTPTVFVRGNRFERPVAPEAIVKALGDLR